MRIGLFAANVVGKRIARFMGDQGEAPACLVLDANDSAGLNPETIAGSGVMDSSLIFDSSSLKEEQTLARLRALDLDLIVLAWWPYILKAELIEIPRLGCLNFHPSFLPYNRGKHYNFWAIVERAPFGVTIHWVDVAVDCGDIAFQSRIETSWEDTGATLYYKAQEEIVRLFKEKFSEIKAGRIPRLAQDLAQGSVHRARELEEASRIELDQTYPARALLNLIRARTFPPYPAVSFVDEDQRYEVRIEIKKVDEGEQN
ncbi:MAG: formyltransferase family protein [Acidobacteriota bacterium]